MEIPKEGILLTDLLFDEAQRIREDLEAQGILCGHPSEEDTESVIVKLMLAGYITERQDQ